MSRSAVAALLLCLTSTGMAQRASERWAIEIRGRGLPPEHAELRVQDGVARILVGTADSGFQTVSLFQRDNGAISFVVPGDRRRFRGRYDADTMSGDLEGADGAPGTWSAQRMSAESRRWPVAPRVVVRQLVVGTTDTLVTIPPAWVAVLPADTTLDAEYRAEARAAGLLPVSLAGAAPRQRGVALGFDQAGRAVMRATFERALTRSNDPTLRALFVRPHGIVLDIHDAAMELVPQIMAAFRLYDAADGLSRLDELHYMQDSAAIREAAWRVWTDTKRDSARTAARLDSLVPADSLAGRSLRALLRAYDRAEAWWLQAVRALLVTPWLETPDGVRSPTALVAAFWGTPSLEPPPLATFRFGDLDARPLVGATRLGPAILRPANASAREWLASGGMGEALDVWRALEWGPPLATMIDGTMRYVMSPALQNRIHGDAFLPNHDLIRIEPGITPIAAIGIIIHEWQHLLFTQRRFDLPGVGVRVSAHQTTFASEDPWLAEGAAEWATEEILRPTRRDVPLLSFTATERRRAVRAIAADDPHFLGYRLVRGAARGHATSVVRDRLLHWLHDPATLARRFGLGGSRGEPLRLPRPPDAALIPEVQFTWDDGLVDKLSHRLIISTPRREP